MPTRRRALIVLLILVLLAWASLILALAVGSIAINSADFIDVFTNSSDTLATEIIRGLRLPRAIGAFACVGVFTNVSVDAPSVSFPPIRPDVLIG